MGQFDLRTANLEQELQYGLQGIEADRLSREAAIAAQVRAAMNQPQAPQAQGVRVQPPNPIAQAVRPGGTSSGFRNRSEEHTSELQSLMRISYAVFCLKK